jgi:hypothetical protein
MSDKIFRSSKKENQLGMFTSIPGMLQGTSYEQYNNSQAWHNMFRVHVLDRIEESLFKSLFSENMGAPNASIRVIIGMMTLKEAFGWSDNELFEHCRFNLLIRSALGLFHINDSIPAESTYYLFRKRIYNYNKENQVDLIEKVFQQITNSQAMAFNVSGRSVRMDSKLIGSNIAFSSRYEIVHDTLVLFYNEMIKTTPIKLSGEELAQLQKLSGTTGNKVVYRSTREEFQMRLFNLGILCYKVLTFYEEKDNKHYPLLKRVFDEHFGVGENGQTEISPKEEIKSDNVQSPYDTDCAYRNDTQTGEIIPSYKNRSGKWTIKSDKGYRYFSDYQIETCHLRKQIELIPAEKRNKPSNIEATIFQLSYFTRNNKTRYRGLVQHKIWALLRCIWINLKRITIFVEQTCQRACFLINLHLQTGFLYLKNQLRKHL